VEEDEADLLALEAVIPGVAGLLGLDVKDRERKSERTSSSSSLSDLEVAQNRLRISVRKFMRSISSSERPLVLFIDDIQWADEASLDLLESIATDPEISGLFVVLAFRDDEKVRNGRMVELGTNEHRHLSLLDRLQSIQSQKCINFVEIKVGNLQVVAVNDLLFDVLNARSLEETKGLASVVHQRTGGNTFFVIQYLNSLVDEGLLAYSFGTLSWHWKEEDIQNATQVTDNVADLLERKLEAMDKDVQSVLKMASCLGRSFCDGSLNLVVSALRTQECNSREADCTASSSSKLSNGTLLRSSVAQCLDMCVAEGLLDCQHSEARDKEQPTPRGLENEDEKGLPNSVIDRSFRFSHDQVLEAAQKLIPCAQQDRLKLSMGETLLRTLPSVERNNSLDQSLLFTAVDLLNQGINYVPVDDWKRRIKFAGLNLRVGLEAMASLAFRGSLIYLEMGIYLLQEQQWSPETSSLRIDLYCAAAEANYCIGEFNKAESHTIEVLRQPHVSAEDKFRAKVVQIDILKAQNQFQDAISAALSLLDQLDVKLPSQPSKFAVVKEVIKTKLLLRKRNTNSLNRMSLMKDKMKVRVMRLLNSLAPTAYMARPSLLAIITCHAVSCTVQHGACRYSPSAFASFGILLCLKGDLKGGNEFGDVALGFLEHPGMRETIARTLMIVHSCVYHWVHPIQQSIQPLLEGYRIGLENGDIEGAMLSLHCHFVSCFVTGRPLEQLEADIRSYFVQMKEYRQEAILAHLMLIWKMILTLMGHLESETSRKKFVSRTATGGGGIIEDHSNSITRCWLAYYFGDYDLASSHADTSRRLERPWAHVLVYRDTMFQGLVAIAMARKTKRRCHKRRASVETNKMRKWCSAGNVNCLSMLHLLEAERATLGRAKRGHVRKLFDKAIASASRHGLQHDKALASERAGLFFAGLGDVDWASHYLWISQREYERWGAHAKVRHLSEKYSRYLAAARHSNKMSLLAENVRSASSQDQIVEITQPIH